MYTQTLIASLAMGHLGDRDIADIDDVQDSNAQILKTRYGHARDSIFCAHDWHWARRSAQLQQKITPPVVRYLYAYALPANYARIANVSEYENMDPQLDENGWDVTDGELTTNAGYVFIDYVAMDWSEAKWPAYFADCVALKLAEIACLRITHSAELKQVIAKQLAQVTLPYARSTDSTSQPARKTIVRSGWQRARLGGGQLSNLRRT